MKDLRTCLLEYSPPMLEAIAQGWGITVRSSELEGNEEKATVVQSLMQRMITPEAVAQVTSGLTAEERQALAQVTQHGVVPARPWTRAHGAIERMGGARLERLKPWLTPSTPVERLWYLGLVYRGYGVVGSYRGEVYFVPPELLDLLPRPAPAQAEFHVEPRSQPSAARVAGMALARDVMALLSHIKGHDIRAKKGDYLGPRDILLLKGRLELDGEAYLAFLQHVTLEAGLLRRREGQWQPSTAAKEWLQSRPAARMHRLYETWLEDMDWDELDQIPSLRPQKAGQRRDPRAARQRAIGLLGHCEPGQWYGIADWVQAVKSAHPDFLRPDADYDTWYIQDAETGDYLTGFGSWDRVEGALLAHLLQGPLHWLGAIALGEGEGPLFSITQMAAHLMPRPGAAAPEISEPPLVIREDLTVSVSPDANLYDRYQLERFAELASRQGGAASYRITKPSVWRSLEEGIEVEQIISFLQRASAGRLPKAVARALRAWAARFGRIKLANVTLLMARDEATMAELRAHGEIRPYLGEALSPRICLVDERRIRELVQLLKRLEYWPRIEDLG